MINKEPFNLLGDQMKASSQEFAEEPCSSMKRGAMVRAARALLSSVTRLLILADMVDVHLLLKKLRVVIKLCYLHPIKSEVEYRIGCTEEKDDLCLFFFVIGGR